MSRYARVTSLLLAFGMIAVADAAAQAPSSGDTPKRVAIRRLLALQQTDSIMLRGIETELASEEARPDPSLPAGFMDSVKARMRRDIGQFVERLVPVYDSLYTADEVTQLIAFYQSPLGRRMVETQVPLSLALRDAGQQWGIEVSAQVLLDISRQRKRP